MLRNDERRFGAIAQLLHWLIAVLIIAMFALGWYMEDLPTSPHKLEMYTLHKSLGMTVFALAVLRLGWRLHNPAPPYPAHMPAWERRAAATSHVLLYALIFVQPLIGFLHSNAANFPVVVWGVVPLPAILPENEAVAETLIGLHSTNAIILATLVLVHVAAALRHHFWVKDDVLRRMLPGTLNEEPSRSPAE